MISSGIDSAVSGIPGGSIVNSALSALTGSSIGQSASTIINGSDKQTNSNIVSGEETSLVHNNEGLTADDVSHAVAAGTQFIEQQAVTSAMANRAENFPSISENSQHISDNAWDSTSILSKPLKLISTTWDSTLASNSIIANIDIYYNLFNQLGASRVSKLANSFRYIRTGFRLKVQLTSTKFNSGKMKAVYFPPTHYHNGNPQDHESAISITRLYAMPGSELSASGPGATDVIAPFSAVVPYFSMKRRRNINIPPAGAQTVDFYNWGHLVLFNMTALRVPDTAPSSVSLIVWLQLEEPKLAIPTRPLFNDLQVNEDDGEIDNLKNEILRLKSRLQRMHVQSAVSNENDIFSTNKTLIHGGSHSPIILGQHPTPSVGTTMITSGDDANSLTEFFQREGFLKRNVWTASDATDHILFNFTVAPVPRFATPTTVNDVTPVGYGSLPFNYWRGDMNFRFSIAKTQFIQGRLQFFYSPGNDTVSTDDLSELYTTTWDVSEASDIKIRVPFMYHKDWCINSSASAGFDQDFSHGSIIVRVLNRLVTNDGSQSSVDVLCYMSAAENYQVANIRPYSYGELLSQNTLVSALTSLQLKYPVVPTSSKKKRMEVQSLLETTLPSTEYESAREPFILGSMTAPILSNSSMNMDIMTNFSDLLSRPTRSVAWRFTDGGPDYDWLRIPMTTRLIKPIEQENPVIFSDLFLHFQNCFRYWSGGFNFTIMRSLENLTHSYSTADTIKAVYLYNANYYTTIDTGIGSSLETYWPATTFSMDGPPMASFNVPLVSQNSVLMTDYDWHASNETPHQGEFALSHHIQAGHVGLAVRFHEDWTFTIYRSALPEFKFSYFIGVPDKAVIPTYFVHQMGSLLEIGELHTFLHLIFRLRNLSGFNNNSGQSTLLVSIRDIVGVPTIRLLVQMRVDEYGTNDGASVLSLFGL